MRKDTKKPLRLSLTPPVGKIFPLFEKKAFGKFLGILYLTTIKKTNLTASKTSQKVEEFWQRNTEDISPNVW